MPLITEMLNSLNTARTAEGLTPLRLNDKLTVAAQQHADFMREKQLLSHMGKNRSSFDQRILDTGYRFRTAAENIALGALDPEGVVELWMRSPPHRANVLNTDVIDAGIGISPVEGSETTGRPLPRRYWSLSLAAPEITVR